ncbi:MAG: methyltransferase domain-containing protein [Thermoleophilia bacterium]
MAEKQNREGRQLSGSYREEFGRVARFYDFGVRQAFRWVGGEIMFRCGIVEAADVSPGQAVLDVACGTGTLAQLLAGCAGPGGRVTGVDISERMLGVARRKAEAQGLWPPQLEFIQANAEDLPFGDAGFDCATASLAIHELNRQGRTNALAEMHRVLRPGGRIVIADMRPPDTPITRLGMSVVRLGETDTLPDMWHDGLFHEIGQAGFGQRWRRIVGKGFFEILTGRKGEE